MGGLLHHSLFSIMRVLLLACALLAPIVASAQAKWTFQNDVSVPYTTAPGTGAHGVAVDNENRLWVQNYYGSEPLVRNGVDLTTTALYVLNSDGTEAPCSPVLFIKDVSGAVVDTLGYYTKADGTRDNRTGRGMTSDADGNILVTQYDKLYQLDASSCATAGDNSIVQIAAAQPIPGQYLTQATHDALGNVYVMHVIGADKPIYSFGPGLTPAQNVADHGYAISRDLQATQDGLAVIDVSFTAPGAVVHYRSNTFFPFDSLGVTLRGLSIESAGYQPVADLYWFSSGPGGAVQPNTDPLVETYYQAQSWYGFSFDDLVTRDALGNVTGTVENPSPRDSIIVTAAEWGSDIAGPRGIAFSDDGKTAYLAHYAAPTPNAIKKYTLSGGTATGSTPDENGLALAQNRPNPFTGETEITFALETSGFARLRVFDVTGREVASLVNRPLSAGSHSVTLDASSLAPGVYVYTLEFEGHVAQRRMSVVR